jgi:tripeptide aminopeptidase
MSSNAEQDNIVRTFLELCEVRSSAGGERRCVDLIIGEFQRLDLPVEEDNAGEVAGTACGNLHVQVKPQATLSEEGPSVTKKGSSILFCAHLDRDEPLDEAPPQVVDGWIESEASESRGFDHKASVAVLLELARELSAKPPTIGVEFLFTVGNPNELLGAKHFDRKRLRSNWGFLFDYPGSIGKIVTASPCSYKVEADFRGKRAHATINPEDGRSAIIAAARAITVIRHGRLDSGTTVNIGSVTGGRPTARGMIPEECRLTVEVRSLHTEKAENQVSEVIDSLYDGAAAAECDVDVTSQRFFDGYTHTSDSPVVAIARGALERAGYAPEEIHTCGGSAANVLQGAGLSVVNLGNGITQVTHGRERVAVATLNELLNVARGIVSESQRQSTLPERSVIL